MSQENRTSNQPRRKLTPEQKRQILKRRKRRRMLQRLKIILPIAILVIIAVALLCTILGGGKDEQKSPAPTMPPAAAPESTETPVDPAADSAADSDATAQGGEEAALQMMDADGAIQPEDSAAPSVAASAVKAGFDFDEAYIRAVQGEITGPDVVYDGSSIDPAKLDRWPATKEGYIPILKNAKTEERIIAVTVDDCFQGENFRAIVQCAIENNASLTIFPLGKNLGKTAVDNALRLAYSSGMEIGNHTYNHAGMFHYDQDRMMNEIWQQRETVNQVLGVNYTQHFFRPRGGDEREDQRMHAYLNQLGYSGVAMWNKDGSNEPMEKLFNELAPGNIYLFHTTDNDKKKLLQFIPGAVERGYKLVTMSEMFGLPQNTVSDLSPVATPEEMQAFRILPTSMKDSSYLRAAAVVQQRLIELGWMDGKATGVYGNQTFVAVGFFQMALDMQPNGVADVELQKLLFSDDAPRGSLERVQEFCRQLGKEPLTQLPGTTNTEIPMDD